MEDYRHWTYEEDQFGSGAYYGRWKLICAGRVEGRVSEKRRAEIICIMLNAVEMIDAEDTREKP